MKMSELRQTLVQLVLVILGVLVIVAIVIGPDKLIFDQLIPLIPGEQVQAFGVYASRAICLITPLRKKTFLGFDLIECANNEQNQPLRVILTVNKGGSVFAARASYDFAWRCGWCPTIAHSDATIWPPQPDHLPAVDSDVYIAIPMALHWEKYAFKYPNRDVKCVVITREPLKRLKSLLQYAWEAGEPALWEASKQMHKIMDETKDWNKVLEWSWDSFVKGSMENTHEVLMTGMRNKACQQIQFEDFSTNYNEAFTRWMRIWEINEKAIPTLLNDQARHDLSKLTPEQKAKHHHISGKSFSKDDQLQLDQAVKSHASLMELVQKQRKDLGYS